MVVSSHTELPSDAKLCGQRQTGRGRRTTGVFGWWRAGWRWRRRGEELER